MPKPSRHRWSCYWSAATSRGSPTSPPTSARTQSIWPKASRSSITGKKSTSAKSGCRQHPVADGGDGGGRWDRDDPRPHYAPRDSPTHRGETIGSAGSHDGAGNGVRGAHRDPVVCGNGDGDGAAGLRGKPADGSQARDARAHGVDDSPAAEQRTQRYGGIRAHLYPEWNSIIGDIQVMEETGLGSHQRFYRHQQSDDDPHRFLRVVTTVRM